MELEFKSALAAPWSCLCLWSVPSSRWVGDFIPCCKKCNSFLLSFSFINKEKGQDLLFSCQLLPPKFPNTALALKLMLSIVLLQRLFRQRQLEKWSLSASWKRAPLPPGSRHPGPVQGGSLFVGRQRELRLSHAEPALAGRNQTILIYQIDKILSLQLRRYVINCVLITAAATSSECSNLQRNWGRCFQFVCVNSASTNSAACVTPRGAGPWGTQSEGKGLLAVSLPGWGGFWKSLREAELLKMPLQTYCPRVFKHFAPLSLAGLEGWMLPNAMKTSWHRNVFGELLASDTWLL